MKKVAVIGQSRETIERLTQSFSRQDLLDLVHQLATWEPKFSPSTVASLCEMTPRAIVARIKDGTIKGAHKPLDNGWRISLSGLREWDEQTAVKALINGTGNGH